MFRDLLDDLDDDDIPGPDTFLDVPFVPSDDAVVRAMLTLGKVGRKDRLYDLGSGDGRILITAARERGTRGIGIEIDPLRIADAMDEAGHFGVEYLVDFIEEDIFTAEFRDATVITLYLLESINIQLRPRLLSELRPGSRIVSHAFDMGDWKADERLEVGGISIYKWVVPAQVEGIWEWEGAGARVYRVELQQKYQEVSGTAWIGDDAADVESAVLTGSCLALTIRDTDNCSRYRFTLDFENKDAPSVTEHN